MLVCVLAFSKSMKDYRYLLTNESPSLSGAAIAMSIVYKGLETPFRYSIKVRAIGTISDGTGLISKHFDIRPCRNLIHLRLVE